MVLGGEPDSADVHLRLAQLRMQAESVPEIVALHASKLKSGSFFRQYPVINDVIKRCQTQPHESMSSLMRAMTPAAWSALEDANNVLSQHSREVPISAKLEHAYVDQVRALIDQVADDDTLSAADRSRLVNLLRNVEQALLDMKISGTLPVQEAAAAAGAIVRLSPSLWERVKSRPWVRDFGTVMVGLCMMLEATANTLAIERYFSDEPQKVIVIDHQDRQDQQDGRKQSERQDQNGQRADHHPTDHQPADQPTPR